MPQLFLPFTLLYLSYDISEMLQPGENTIAIWQGPGWARYSFFKTRPSPRVQMDATLAELPSHHPPAHDQPRHRGW